MTDFSEKVCGLNPTYTRLDCLVDTTITGNVDEDGPTGDDGEETINDPPPPGGGGTTTNPHNPPDPEPPATTAIFVTSKGAVPGEVATNAVEVTPTPGDNLTQEDLDNTMTSAGMNAVDKAGENYWVMSMESVGELIHFDISTPTAIVKSYTHDVLADAETGAGSPAAVGARGMFYSEKTDRIYIAIYHLSGVANKHSWLVYDVSGDKTTAPTLLMTHGPIGTNRNWGFEVSDDESVIYVMSDVDPGAGNQFMLSSLTLDIDAGTFTVRDQLAPFGVTAPGGAFGNLRKVSDTDLFVWVMDANVGNKLVWVDTTDPDNMTVLDTYEWANANERCQGITLNTDNTRLYAKMATNSADTLASFDIFDVSVSGTISKVSSTDLAGTVKGFGASRDLIHYVAIDEIDDYLILVHDRAVWTYSIIGDVVTLIDNGNFAANDSDGMGAPEGPNTFRYSTGSVEGPPVSANIATVTARKNGNGVAFLVGLDTLATPTLDAIIRKSALDQVHGPSMNYIYSSGHLCLLGKNTGTLMIYELGADFALAATLQSDTLKTCQGLQNSPDEETIWTVDSSGNIIEIDVTDPTAPTITASTASGPDYFTRVGDPELVGRTRDHLLMENHGYSLVSMSTRLRTGSYLPIELYGARLIVMDSTYAYIWNDQGGGGLAIVEHTATGLTLRGYLDLGSFTDIPSDMILLGSHVYITHASTPVLTVIDVSDTSNPVETATSFDLLGTANAIAANGANEVVLFGGGNRGGSFTLKRIDVTTPATPVETATLSDSRALSGGSVANGKAVGFDMNGLVAVSYSLTDPILEKDTVSFGRSVGSAQAYGWTDTGKDYVAALTSHTDIYDDEIVVIDVSAVVAIDIEGRVDVSGMTHWGFDPATGEGIAVGSRSSSVRPIDLTTPAVPLVGTALDLAADLDWKLAANDAPHSAQLLGNVALLGFPQSLNSGGLIKLDVTTIASPTVDDRVGDNFIAARSPSITHLHPIRATSTGVGVTSFPEYRIYALTTGGLNPRAGEYTDIIYSPAITAQPESLGPNSSALTDDGTVLFVGHKQASEANTAWRVTAYDVSVLSAVVSIGAITVGRPIRSIDVLGQTQNIVVVHGGVTDIPKISVYDFTDPANPSLTGSLELGDEPFVAWDVRAY